MKIWYFLISVFCFIGSVYGQRTLYLSPAGNDTGGDGSKENPFLSLERALENKGSGLDDRDIMTILVEKGDYFLERPIRIDNPLGSPVVVRGVGKIKPRLLGGVRISGWKPYGDKLYRAYVPEVLKYGFVFEQFYVNGHRATLARTPNEDWYVVKGSSEKSFAEGVRAADYAVQRIQLGIQDISSLDGMTREECLDIKFCFYHKWDITQKRAAYVDVDSGFIHLAGAGMNPWNPVTTGSRYILSNYSKGLDVPGEWFLDRRTGYVYYMPLPGETMETAFCVAPALRQLMTIEGCADAPVGDVHFENLSFQYAAHLMPENGEEPAQAAAFTEAAFLFNFAENISFVDCELMHTGGYGMWLKQECNRNLIEHCYLADLGAGGIKIGEPFFRKDGRQVSEKNVVNNNILKHIGSELPCGVGIALFHTSDNRITHNDIADLRYSGISVGWFWGYNQSPEAWTSVLDKKGKDQFYQARLVSPAVRNIIEFNHVHHIGWGELSDMGAIYTLGESPGTSVSNNVIHDVLSYDYGGWGLYTDEGSTGVVMKNNLVYRCKSGGFHQHYGKENKIENNIFAYGYYYQAQFTRVEDHLSFSFRHNIVLQEQGETLSGPWKNGNISMDRNLYWSEDGGAFSFNGLGWKKWKEEKEPHSIVASPLFLDAANDDFRFRSLRNIKKIGFVPFDYSKAGVYGSEEWKAKARLSPDILNSFKHRAEIRLNK